MVSRRAALQMVAGMACSALLISAAQAQSVADFYRGKTISLIIGTSAGNDYDYRGRLVARFIGKYIPGEPIIVPRNMPGGGGIQAANWVSNIAPRDGTVMHMIMQNMMAAQAVQMPGVEFDTRKLIWIGNTTSAPNVINSWHTSGVTSIEQVRTQELAHMNDAIAAFAERLPKDVLFVIDAAYAEYVRRNDYEAGVELVATNSNVVMTRTFSKLFGLAALRLGWAYCPPGVADVLNRIRGAFNVSNSAQATALALDGVEVVTFNFPYMDGRRGAPDRAPVLETCLRTVVDAARAHGPSVALFIGGKSMGGRMATHVAAQGLHDLRGVITLGYPLHPPGQPDRLRTAHLSDLRVPWLIVQGERDTFGSPTELAPFVDAVPGGARLVPVSGADHSLTVRREPPEVTRSHVVAEVTAWMRAQSP